MALALVGVIGGIIAVLLSLLILMIKGLKDDLCRDQNGYKADKKEITLRLDEHGDRILVLEIKVKDDKR